MLILYIQIKPKYDQDKDKEKKDINENWRSKERQIIYIATIVLIGSFYCSSKQNVLKSINNKNEESNWHLQACWNRWLQTPTLESHMPRIAPTHAK